MGTGTKIAIGCGCLVLLAGAAVVGVVGYGAYLAKGKIQEAGGSFEQMAANAEAISKWEKQANAHPFTAPADGVIQEQRLRSFLDVRKGVFAVYERHKAELEKLEQRTKGGKDLGFGDTLAAGAEIASLTTEIRLAQLKGLAGVGMNEEEYRYIQMAVYKSAWAASAEKESGRAPAEALGEVATQLEAGAGTGLSEADRQKVQDAVRDMGEASQALEVPRSNVELFRKYQAEIEKYAMHGLAMIGL